MGKSHLISHIEQTQANINIIIFPDWLLPEESLYLELERVIKAIATHPISNQIKLLIHSDDISQEKACLVMSSLLMNLLIQQNFDLTEGCEISLVSELEPIEWESIASNLHANIILKQENQEALALFETENLSRYEIEEFSYVQIGQLFFDLSNRLFHQRRWQEAIAQYQKLLAIKSYDANIDWCLSECYRQLNRLEEAFCTLREGIKLHPQDGNLHFSLIMHLRRSGRTQETITSTPRRK